MKPLACPKRLRTALASLTEAGQPFHTQISWVNWREGAQIKIGWNRTFSLFVYIDIRESGSYGSVYAARNALLERAFKHYMPEGSEPQVRDRYTRYASLDYQFTQPGFISPNEIVSIAEEMGIGFSVLYIQECVSARSAFNLLGIPLDPGEMGKEWINGEYLPYSCPIGKCL